MVVRLLRFEKRYDWFKDCGDKEVVKETWQTKHVIAGTRDESWYSTVLAWHPPYPTSSNSIKQVIKFVLEVLVRCYQ